MALLKTALNTSSSERRYLFAASRHASEILRQDISPRSQAFTIVLGGLASLQKQANNVHIVLPQQQAIYVDSFQSGGIVRFCATSCCSACLVVCTVTCTASESGCNTICSTVELYSYICVTSFADAAPIPWGRQVPVRPAVVDPDVRGECASCHFRRLPATTLSSCLHEWHPCARCEAGIKRALCSTR